MKEDIYENKWDKLLKIHTMGRDDSTKATDIGALLSLAAVFLGLFFSVCFLYFPVYQTITHALLSPYENEKY